MSQPTKRCVACAEEILKAAKKCRFCGESQTAKYRARAKPSVVSRGGNGCAWIALVMIVLGVWLVASCQSRMQRDERERQEKTRAKMMNAKPLDASRVYDRFKVNPAKAKSLFDGKAWVVSGTVKEIGARDGFFGGTTFSITIIADRGSRVVCFFESAQAIDDLKRGQSIKVAGMASVHSDFDGMSLFLHGSEVRSPK